MAWDASGLLPDLQSKFGDFVVPIVLAHEWGHAIQARSNFTARTVTKELQADCCAGGWAKHAKDAGLYKVNAAEMDNALAGILTLKDSPGTSKIDSSAHGSGFDRVSAFQDGYDNGPNACKEYRDDTPIVVERPFQNAEDEAAGGDMPQFVLAAMTRANDKSEDKTQSLRGDCFAGAYTASVLLQNRKDTSSFGISPGDLDEAITALLVFRVDGDVERQGAGFERIRHYRNGVLNGAEACLKD
ncbi:neutral zinc metallopeptidase [Mycolicibacterium sarraceniae]|uniref:Peptidase n=1 Tax=Mycolicibacterium sarraceniae TaxID=1534348 RepID=A0A7I7SJM1_9MYCO|nr:neutral zinc metallopeptidase [Mycolicibacterium sarraceniae]BBY56968.1 hypothetical protein MSAR_01040 [Mycolicibacterium sarraceniae]